VTSGNGHIELLNFERAPTRVVSLVPSMTDSLFELGLGDRLVGVTDFCQPPAPADERLVRVGGTRAPDVSGIAGLKPDLVLANQEENSRPSIEKLEKAGLRVWTTFPRSADEALQVLWAMLGIFRTPQAGPKVATLEMTLAWARRAAEAAPAIRTFCPIWRAESKALGPWWMTFNDETYAGDLLRICGGENVFAGRQRRYPLAADLGQAAEQPAGENDTRYPRVTPQEIIDAQPDLILLPDEPFAFGSDDAAQIRQVFGDTPAVRAGRVVHVDGRLVTWHGTRLARALAELPGLIQSSETFPGQGLSQAEG
jgi:iron complex transport system substrate-binding protein